MTALTKEQSDALLWALRETRRRQIWASAGICWNVRQYLIKHVGLNEAERIHSCGALLRLFKTWPEHSGNPEFPVPHSAMCASLAYSFFSLWNKRTEYGRSRFRLLDHAIAELEKAS